MRRHRGEAPVSSLFGATVEERLTSTQLHAASAPPTSSIQPRPDRLEQRCRIDPGFPHDFPGRAIANRSVKGLCCVD
jgi:hypothetical protein